MTEAMLLHITSRQAWEQTDGDYRDRSLDGEGFIHCSTPGQVLIPANERFSGRSDLVLLLIDPDALDAPLVYEDCYESGMAFPHVYGPICRAAVVGTVAFPPNADGTFSLPPLEPTIDQQ